MKKTLFLALFLIPLNAFAENISLEKAVNIGIKNNHMINSKMAQIEGAKADARKTKNMRLPKASLNAMYTKSDDPVYSFASSLKQGTFSMASMATANNPASLQNYNTSFEIGVPIFTGFQISNALKAGEIKVNKSKDEFSRANAQIKFQLSYQWMTVLLRQKLLNLVESSIISAETEINSAKRLKEKGMVLGSDFFASEAIFGKLKTYQIQWKEALRNEKEKLNIMLGKNQAKELNIEGDFSNTPFILPSLEKAISSALAKRKDLKAVESHGKLANIFVSMEKNSILPTVMAFASMESNSENLSDPGSSYIYGLKLSMPIGDTSYFAKKASAKAQKRRSNEIYKDYKRKVKTEVIEAYNNYYSSVKSLEISGETALKARKSLDLFRPMYRQGKQSVMEVLRAEATLLELKAAHFENLYKMHLYHAQSLLTAEMLDNQAIIKISNALQESMTEEN
ncbi:MAG: TolC family protein [Elusimicrobiota bacterium]|nr:TolC family protein [Elusimicrobiota bacterium]